MTENEAKKWMNVLKNWNSILPEAQEACGMAEFCLEEIQQYRAIGTIEEFKALKECVYVDERPFIFTCPNCKEIYTLEQDGRLSFCRKCNEKIDWDKIVFYQL